MFRHRLVWLALVLFAVPGAAQEIVLPHTQAPPEHNSARFSDLMEVDYAGIPTVVEEHGERWPSHARRGVRPMVEAEPVSVVAHSAVRAGRSPVRTETPAFSYPVTMASFQGLGDSGTSIPPDTTGAVGPQHVMVTLNTQVRISDRSGNTISTKSLATFWSPLGSFSNVFDPRVLYDPYGQRWVAAAVANSNSNNSSILVAVSSTSDPTGSWSYYKYSGDPNPGGPKSYWADYTNLGFNKNWIVVSVNLIPFGSGSTNDARILAISKADLYSGAANPMVTPFVVNNSNTLVPAHTYDNTLETMYLTEEWDNSTGQLRISTITGPIGGEVISTGTAFVNSNSSWTSFPQNDFEPQKGDARLISGGDSRLQNLIYRNGDLWASHTVFLPAGGSPDHSLVQWWQMSPSGTLKQFVRIEDVTKQNFYAYPGLAVNKDNFVMVGFTQFSSTIYPSAAYALQAPGTVNHMTVAPIIYKQGTNSYYKDFGLGENRWGDFSVSVVDPVDDTDLWTLQEYSATITPPSSSFGVWWLHIFPGDGQIDAKPTSLSFGSHVLQTSTAQQITIVNSTAAAATISGITFSGMGAGSYSQVNNCPASLATGASCLISVTFKPQTAGVLSANLVVNSDAVPAGLQVPLTGTGQDNGLPDAYPGNTLTWSSPVTMMNTNLTADVSDPVPSCLGNLAGAGQRASSGWATYVAETDGSISYSATSSADFGIAVFVHNRRTGLYEMACTRAHFASGVFSVTQPTFAVGRTNTYYFMIAVAPGSASAVTLNVPSAGSPTPLMAISSGTKFYPDSLASVATQAFAISNATTTAQAFGMSSGNPSFALQFVNPSQCSPSIPADATCVATVSYSTLNPQPALPHATGTLSLSGNVSPTSVNLQALLPTDLAPYSTPFAHTVEVLPFTDTKLVPTIPITDNTACFSLKAPLFYTFSPTTTGTISVNLANFVVNVSGSDASSACYSQFGAGSDSGFAVTAGVTYILEIGTDARATLPPAESVTLTSTGLGSVFSLSPSPIFFGRFPFGGISAPVTMTLSNGSANSMPVSFSGAPFVVSNSNCGASLAANSSCTFDLTLSAPAPTGALQPNTAVFSAGITNAAVAWNSPQMTLLASSSSVQFSTTSVNAVSATKTLVLLMQDNVGPVQINTTGDFAQTNDCNLASYARPYCTVGLTFNPTIEGPASGSLTVDYNLNPPSGFSPSTLTIPLSGNALSPTSIRPGRTPVPSGALSQRSLEPSAMGPGKAEVKSSPLGQRSPVPASVPSSQSRPRTMNKKLSPPASRKIEHLDGVN